MQRLLAAALILSASPALAASGPFFSLKNTDFVVTLAFLLFIAVLIYFKVPSLLSGLLDKRAADIQSELDEARALREEAQMVLASYERKQAEVQEQANQIVEAAKREASQAAEQAKADLETSIARRLSAAEDQIASAQAAVVRDVRDRAIVIATEVAGEVIAKELSAKAAGSLIDSAIDDVGAKLH